MDLSRDSWPTPRSSSERPWLRLVVDSLHGWVTPAAPLARAVQPVGHSRAYKVARRSAKAAEARAMARAAEAWAALMPACAIRDQAEGLADVRYELAEAWFWLAGGDARTAWERRCKAHEIMRRLRDE